MISLSQYIEGFKKLKRANTKYGKAPHKPILILTLIELIDKELVIDNRFRISADFVGLFQENWRLLVNTAHQSDFTQPFYYLQSDKILGQQFWQLHTYSRMPLHTHVKSVETLSRLVDYASFSIDLFQLMMMIENRLALKKYILQYYFPDTFDNYLKQKKQNAGFYNDIQSLVLNDPIVKYKHIEIVTEEDVFVRSHLFKRYIPQIYNDTCAITGMQIRSSSNYNFVDACHIVPFSINQDDRVINGLALCPNMHRAFDRGLIAIDADYRIKVSSALKDDINHPYSLSVLKNKKMYLPKDNQYYPSIENLDWHLKEIFKG